VITQSLTSLFYLTLGVVLWLLGFMIINEDKKQRINRITGIMMFLAGTGPIFGGFGLLIQSTASAPVDFEPFRRLFLIWEFFFPQMLLFSFVFPREIPWTKRHPRLSLFIFLPHLIHFILVIAFSGPEQIHGLIDLDGLNQQFGIIIQPVTILMSMLLSLLGLIYKFHLNFFSLINLIYIIAAIILMVLGYRSITNKRLKKQVGLVIWGIRISVALYAFAFIFPHLNIVQVTQTTAHLLSSLALLIGVGSIAWAIIRYQFLDVRLIIRRGLIFSAATALLIGFYLLIYSQGKRLVSQLIGVKIPLLEILFIIVALLFFQPILNMIERLIERFFMRDQLDYRNILQNLSHDIMTTLDTSALREKITKTLKRVMSIENVILLLNTHRGSFTCTDEANQFRFNANEPWIKILKDGGEPMGFDELCLRSDNDPHLEKLRVLNPVLMIPFCYRDECLGILVLSEKLTKTSFSTEDMTILSVLSDHAAVAFENARLYEEMLEKQRMEEELGVAREIQTHLLPKESPSTDRFELAGYNLPSKEVGGDYYDFIQLEENKLGIAIGDIAGKGIPAALLMSNLQAALRISAVQAKTTHDVMDMINAHITATTSAEKFATFFYSVLDSENLTMEYTNAGHNFPVLCRANGEHHVLKEGGVIIGILPDAIYEHKNIQLKSGDAVIMYTDGITEALNSHDEEFGEHRLITIAKKAMHLSAKQILDLILESVVDFTHGYLQTDDLTLVILKVK